MKTPLTSATSNHESGFTLIDLMMIVLMLGILAVIVPMVSLPAIQEGRVEQTKRRMLQIRRAIMGDPDLKVRGNRTDFGYLGDMGDLPDSITHLISQPGGAGTYSQDQEVRFAYGWNGPYLDTSDDNVDWTKDAWGKSLVYVKGTYSSPTTITSYGADGAAGGSDQDTDLVMEIPPEATRFTIHGFVTDAGGGLFTGSGEVALNELDGDGKLAAVIPTPIQADGYFEFVDVSLGRRSLYATFPTPTPTSSVGPVTVIPGAPHYILPSRHLETP